LDIEFWIFASYTPAYIICNDLLKVKQSETWSISKDFETEINSLLEYILARGKLNQSEFGS